jgi:hypothetical protein
MRQLAYVEKIKSLSPIPGADKIEKAEVLGWELVVKKGEFQVGDLCVYCEIDSIFPELPPFEFLRSKKFRIKTIKLRSQISQGLAFPLCIVNCIDPSFDAAKAKVGDDLTDTLKITKYDPESALDDPEPEQIKKSWLQRKYSYYKWKLLGIKPIKKGSFPSDVPKTDETRVQKMGPALEDMVGHPVYITEKCEGTSATFVYRKTGNWLARLFGQDGVFQICSRNRIVYNSQKDGKCIHHLMTVAQTHNIREKLQKLNRNIAIQGEIIGNKIQGNLYKIDGYELRVFLMFDLDKQCYLPFDLMMDICQQLLLPMVPIVCEDAFVVNDIKYYVELSKGKSMINEKIDREGIVIRSLTENFSFKSINPDYLLRSDI